MRFKFKVNVNNWQQGQCTKVDDSSEKEQKGCYLQDHWLRLYLRQRTQWSSSECFHNLLKQHSYLHRTSLVSLAAPSLLDAMCVCVCAFYQIWLCPALYLIYISTKQGGLLYSYLCITLKKTTNNFIVINKFTFNGRMRLSLEMPPLQKSKPHRPVGFRKCVLIRQTLWLKMREKGHCCSQCNSWKPVQSTINQHNFRRRDYWDLWNVCNISGEGQERFLVMKLHEAKKEFIGLRKDDLFTWEGELEEVQ